MKREQLALCLIAGLLLTACSGDIAPTASLVTPPTATVTTQEVVMARAREVVQALRDRDMERLAALVHPVKGVRFSPYAFVRDSDLVLMPEQLTGALADQRKYIWGVYDGSGLPIEMTFGDYFARFVYDRDYASAEHVSYDRRIGQGSTIDNSLEYYPGGHVVEYHFPGRDPALGGMDWRSLRLVFQEEGGVWYLVGVIHDEWTT
ncbi:MAG: hypothetical protein N2508_12290 [Anaerolineae bacterium]|nr:hypothetical protein [Anaerolineae bacterium]